MFGYEPEGWRIDKTENRAALRSPAALAQAARAGQILEGRAVLCDSGHNLIVDLGCMQGVIPGRRALWESVKVLCAILRFFHA